MSDSKKLWEEVDGEIQAEPIELGRYASDDYANDPKHFAFVTSRYRFVSKMLDGMARNRIFLGHPFQAVAGSQRITSGTASIPDTGCVVFTAG